jgi:hypothetical protein
MSSRLLDISRLLRLQTGWRACSRRVGRPPPMPNCTNWLASCQATLHRKGGCPVHQLARSWLQYRLTRASVQRASKSKLPIKLSSLGFPECAWANFNFQLFSSQSCKNPKLVKSAQIRLLYVYLTWLAMRLAHLLRGLRRIQEVSEYKKSRQKQQFFTKSDKHLYWLWG